MKNTCLKIAVIASFAVASAAFANTAQMKDYFSTQSPSAASNSSKANRFPPTDITVTNASTSSIHVVVPGTSIHDTLYPGSVPDHIRNNQGAFYTHIVLEDTYHTVFWSETVCPRALINVHGQPGAYRIIVDGEYCY